MRSWPRPAGNRGVYRTYQPWSAMPDLPGDVSGWVDLSSILDGFQPLRARGSLLSIADAYYHPDASIPGVGGIYHDYGPAYAYGPLWAQVLWYGLRPLEGGPTVHFDPTAEELGVGVWEFYDFFGFGPALGLGTVGQDPSQFALLDPLSFALFNHTDWNPRQVALFTTGEEVSVYLGDMTGALVEVIPPFPVPISLRGSGRHGVTLDAHNCTPDFPPPEPNNLVVPLPAATDPVLMGGLLLEPAA